MKLEIKKIQRKKPEEEAGWKKMMIYADSEITDVNCLTRYFNVIHLFFDLKNSSDRVTYYKFWKYRFRYKGYFFVSFFAASSSNWIGKV